MRRTTIQTNIDSEIEDILNNKQIIQSFGTFTPTDSIALGSLNNKIKFHNDKFSKPHRKAQVFNNFIIKFGFWSSRIQDEFKNISKSYDSWFSLKKLNMKYSNKYLFNFYW